MFKNLGKKRVTVEQESHEGYIAYVRKDTRQEIGRSKTQAVRYCDQNYLVPTFIGPDATPSAKSKCQYCNGHERRKEANGNTYCSNCGAAW